MKKKASKVETWQDLPALTPADREWLRASANVLLALADGGKGFTGEETVHRLQKIEDNLCRISRDLFWRSR